MEKTPTALTLLPKESLFLPEQEQAKIVVQEYWRTIASCSTREARELLPLSLAVRYCALPLAKFDNSMSYRPLASFLVKNADDPLTIQALQQLTNCDIQAEQCEEQALRTGIFAAYLGDLKALAQTLGAAENDHRLSESDGQTQILTLVEQIISYAISLSASDIHFEPRLDGGSLRLRIDGIMREMLDNHISLSLYRQLIRCLKVAANLDITNSGRPLEGSIKFDKFGMSYRLRVSLIPEARGEKAVVRLLEQNETSASHRSFTDLGLRSPEEEILSHALAGNRGTIILSGPTGSGKSTLLHAALVSAQGKNREQLPGNSRQQGCQKSIISIEDPVERLIPNVAQIEVDEAHGRSYQDILSKVLRHDPDIIAIGEIRDLSVASMALNAGLTGHLVISTIHASNALEVITRLLHLGVARELITSSLILTGSQRLIPRNCPSCTSQIRVSPLFTEALRLPAEGVYQQSQGCHFCQYTCVLGRIAVFEFLPIVGGVRDFFRVEGQAAQQRSNFTQLAWKLGYRPLWLSVRDCLVRGEISPLQAIQALGLSHRLLTPNIS